MRRLTIVLLLVVFVTFALAAVQADTKKRTVRDGIDSVDAQITQTMAEVRARLTDDAQPEGNTGDPSTALFSRLWGIFGGVADFPGDGDGQQTPTTHDPPSDEEGDDDDDDDGGGTPGDDDDDDDGDDDDDDDGGQSPSEPF